MPFPTNYPLRNRILSYLEERENPWLITREGVIDGLFPNQEHIYKKARGNPDVRELRKEISRLIPTLGYVLHSSSDNNRVWKRVK